MTLDPAAQRIADQITASLRSAFIHPDGQPVIANDQRRSRCCWCDAFFEPGVEHGQGVCDEDGEALGA